MTLPTSSLSVLLLTVLGVLCLGSWINCLRLSGKWRYELFYFDFAVGAFLGAVAAAFTLGTLGSDGFTLLDDLMRAGKRNMAYAIAAGCVFNLGNMLVAGTTSLAGMSIAFPVSFGLALVISSVLTELSKPQGNAAFVLCGLAAVVAALLFAVLAHRFLGLSKELLRMKAGEHRTLRPAVPWKGVIFALVAGVPLGLYAPLLTMAKSGDAGVGPYALVLLFASGIAFSTVVYDLYLMNLPLQGKPLEILSYFRGQFRQHVFGVLGGAMWTAGALACLVAANAPENALLNPGVSYAAAQAAPLLAALWGALVWKEFKDGDPRSKAALTVMLVLFLAGLVMLALAPFSAAP